MNLKNIVTAFQLCCLEWPLSCFSSATLRHSLDSAFELIVEVKSYSLHISIGLWTMLMVKTLNSV